MRCMRTACAPPPGVRPNRHNAEAGRDRGGGAAGRSAGRERRVVRIAGKARHHRVDVVSNAVGKLGQRRLGQNDTARRAQLGHEGCVGWRVIVLPSLEA